jgi:hypothetical protein
MEKKKSVKLSDISIDQIKRSKKIKKTPLIEEKINEETQTPTTQADNEELGKAGEYVPVEDDAIIEMFETNNEESFEEIEHAVIEETKTPNNEIVNPMESIELIDDITDEDINATNQPKNSFFKEIINEFKSYSLTFKLFTFLSIILVGILIAISVYFYKKTPKNVEQQEQPKQEVKQEVKQEEKTEDDSKSEKEKLQSKLEDSVKSINTPTKVATEDLFGGYILGSTTYYPDDPQKLYIDFTIKPPKEKQPQADDETALKILKTLKSTLPKINETIEVKDKSKVTMEIYKQKSEYQTILLYDGKPFAYVSTDKDLVSTNHVTGEYVSKVAKDA